MATTVYHLQLTGYVGSSTFSAATVRKVLAQYPGKHVDILIDSFGGSLSEGLSICGALRDHGDVTVHFRGMNASAATLASMGAKKIMIAPESMYLVHKVSMGFIDWATRNADQLDDFIKLLQSTKEDLDTMDKSIAELYASRCSRPAKDLLDLMKAEKWISAKDALEWGFVDEITAADGGEKEKSPKPSITRAQASAFQTLGLPLPPVAVEQEEPSKNIVERVISGVINFFSKNMDTQNQTTQNPQNEEQPSHSPAPAAEQAPAPHVENSELDAVRAENERLRAEIEALKKQPAGTTSNVVTQQAPKEEEKPEDESDFARFCRTNKSAQALFNSLP